MTINKISNDSLINILSFAGSTQESVCRRFRSLSRLVCREMVDVYLDSPILEPQIYKEIVNSYRCSPVLVPQILKRITPEESYSLVTRLFKKAFNVCKRTHIEECLRQTPLAIAYTAQESADYNLDLFFTHLCKVLSDEARLSFDHFLEQRPHQQGPNGKAALIRQWMRENPGFLSNVRKLDIYDRHIKELPNEVSMLVNLQELSLQEELSLQDCSGLMSLPDSIGMLANLLKLSLQDCSGLTSVPDSIRGLTNLQDLDLQDCSGLISLPDSIGMLANLRWLHLSHCSGLISLPNSIGMLANLRWLHLSNCGGLMSLPNSIGMFANLTLLDLQGCSGLTSVPDSIRGLTNLQELDLRECSGLTSVPEVR